MRALFILGCAAVRWLVAKKRLKAAIYLKSQIKTETRKYIRKLANKTKIPQISQKTRKYPQQPHPAAHRNPTCNRFHLPL